MLGKIFRLKVTLDSDSNLHTKKKKTHIKYDYVILRDSINAYFFCFLLLTGFKEQSHKTAHTHTHTHVHTWIIGSTTPRNVMCFTIMIQRKYVGQSWMRVRKSHQMVTWVHRNKWRELEIVNRKINIKNNTLLASLKDIISYEVIIVTVYYRSWNM